MKDSSGSIAKALYNTFLGNPHFEHYDRIESAGLDSNYLIRLLEEATCRGSGDLLCQAQVSQPKEGINGPMRSLYLLTKGEINKRLNAFHAANRPKCYQDSDPTTKSFTSLILSQLRRCGYGQCVGLFGKPAIDSLAEIASSINAERSTSKGIIFGRECLEYATVTNALQNPVIWLVAQEYLNCRPILNDIQIWRTAPYDAGLHDLSSDALMWHFDHDYNRFLKVFIYLNDVTELNGPHMCIPRSSFSGIPCFMAHDGRYSDDTVESSGLRQWMHVANKGTVIFGDTLNLHKGLQCMKGERLVMQVQFVDSCSYTPNPDYMRCHDYQTGIRR